MRDKGVLAYVQIPALTFQKVEWGRFYVIGHTDPLRIIESELKFKNILCNCIFT